MLDDHELGQSFLSAVGRVEYAVDGGGIVVPTYKFATFDAGGTEYYNFFVGRDTEIQNNETGVYLTFQGMRQFWGVDTPLSAWVRANYHEKGVVWSGWSGTISGMFVAGFKEVFVYFDFVAHRDSQSKHVKGTLILKG